MWQQGSITVVSVSCAPSYRLVSRSHLIQFSSISSYFQSFQSTNQTIYFIIPSYVHECSVQCSMDICLLKLRQKNFYAGLISFGWRTRTFPSRRLLLLPLPLPLPAVASQQTDARWRMEFTRYVSHWTIICTASLQKRLDCVWKLSCHRNTWEDRLLIITLQTNR